jgi:hypothetical protein
VSPSQTSPEANACSISQAEPPDSNSSVRSEPASNFLRSDHAKSIAGSAAPAPASADSTRTWFATKHGPGYQFQPEVGASRTTLHASAQGVHLSGSLDLGTAGAHLGLENDDGSHGANVGATATLVGAEVTAEYQGYSFTFGESLSWGAGFSSGGERDIDGDGVPEDCFKGSLGPLTFGFCDEL